MAYVHKISKLLNSSIRHGKYASLVQTRSAGFKHVENEPNEEWFPGEYPTNPEEYAKAAARYGMRVEDYKPLPEGHSWGDWPDVPKYGTRDRDNLEYHWDFPKWKRDYMDPIPIDFDGHRDYMSDPTAHTRKPISQARIILTMFGLPALYIFYRMYLEKQLLVDKVGPLIAEKTFPDEGTHYFFCNPDQDPHYCDLAHTGGHENGRYYLFHIWLKGSIFRK